MNSLSPLIAGFFLDVLREKHMSMTTKQVRVLRPYKTFEGRTEYRKVLVTRDVPVTLSVVISR